MNSFGFALIGYPTTPRHFCHFTHHVLHLVLVVPQAQHESCKWKSNTRSLSSTIASDPSNHLFEISRSALLNDYHNQIIRDVNCQTYSYTFVEARRPIDNYSMISSHRVSIHVSCAKLVDESVRSFRMFGNRCIALLHMVEYVMQRLSTQMSFASADTSAAGAAAGGAWGFEFGMGGCGT